MIINDKTPYLIFRCNKCKQYLYVKTTQKTKKCLRCGRTHMVKSILNSGEIINGITESMKYIKKKQNELAMKELGTEPDLRTYNDFCVAVNITKNSKTKSKISNKKDLENYYSEKFEDLLVVLSEMYKKFPSYMVEIMAEDYNIPNSELKILISKFKNEGYLRPLENNYYKISKNKKNLNQN